MFLILNAEQQTRLRTITGPGSALDPRPLANGLEWVLPMAVLADTAHAAHHDELAELPARDVLPEEFPPQPEILPVE